MLRTAGLTGALLAGGGLVAGSAAAERSDGARTPDAGDDWATFGGTAARAGFTSASGPTGDPAARRMGRSKPAIASNLAAVDGVAYFVRNGDDPTAVAFDLERGETRWRVDVAPGSGPGVAVDDGTVYVVGGSETSPDCVPVPPTLAAVDAADGSVRWEREFAPVSVTWPAVVDGTTYVVADDSLVAVDPTGTEAWRTELADGTAADRSLVPAVADGVVVTADAGGVVALDAGDGSLAWRRDLPGAATPAIADGTVYATARTALVALDLTDGTVRWRATGSPSDGYLWPSSDPVVGDGRVYVASDGRRVAAFAAADGTPEWRSAEVGDVSLAVGGDAVYAAASRHSDRQSGVYALDAADGRTTWEWTPQSAFSVQSPVVADGSLLFGGDGLTVLSGD